MEHSPPSSSSGAFKAIVAARARAVHRPPRIVVAEDDPEMRRIIVEALTADGYIVQEAEDGGRLLVRITAPYRRPEVAFDLIISDIRMPVSTGLQILAGLRKARWTVPFILMTAFGDDDTRARAESLGAVLFDKPFSIDDLRTAVFHLAPLS